MHPMSKYLLLMVFMLVHGLAMFCAALCYFKAVGALRTSGLSRPYRLVMEYVAWLAVAVPLVGIVIMAGAWIVPKLASFGVERSDTTVFILASIVAFAVGGTAAARTRVGRDFVRRTT